MGSELWINVHWNLNKLHLLFLQNIPGQKFISAFCLKKGRRIREECVPVSQWLEHCISSTNVVDSILREHTYWQKCIAWMHCKSLWIKSSAKCINVNVTPHLSFKSTFNNPINSNKIVLYSEMWHIIEKKWVACVVSFWLFLSSCKNAWTDKKMYIFNALH